MAREALWAAIVMACTAAALVVGCGDGPVDPGAPDGEGAEAIVAELSASARRARATLIRNAARQVGLQNGVLLAVIAGAADGSCSWGQGWAGLLPARLRHP